jgi:hypothetical protein
MTYASRTVRIYPLVLALALAASACNDLLGIGEPIPAETGTGGAGAGGAPSTASSTGGGGSTATDTGGGGAGGSTTSTTSCTTTTKTLIATEDMCIFDGAGNCGDVSPGALPESNLGFGRGLFRFVLSTDVLTAFQRDTVVGLTLTISRAIGCGLCDNKTAGPFEARPLRNDWVEGNGTAQSGANWCRRTAVPPDEKWEVPGADGAADVLQGEPTGTAMVDTVVESFTISLDPKAHAGWIGLGLDGEQSLSVRVNRPDGTSTVFMMASHEGGDPSKIAQLAVTYCQ